MIEMSRKFNGERKTIKGRKRNTPKMFPGMKCPNFDICNNFGNVDEKCKFKKQKKKSHYSLKYCTYKGKKYCIKKIINKDYSIFNL